MFKNSNLNSDFLLSVSKSQAGQDLFVIAMTQGKTNGRWLEIGADQPIADSNTWLLEKHFDWSGISIELENPALTERQNRWRSLYSSIRGCFESDPPADWIRQPDTIDKLADHIQQDFRRLHNYDKIMSDPELCDLVLPISSDRDWKISRPATDIVFTDALDYDYSALTGSYDYLQMDIDSAAGSIRCLEKILKYQLPGVITFEHDFFRNTPENTRCRVRSREIMNQHGYVLVADDVTCEPDRGWSPDGCPIYFEDWYAHPDQIDRAIIDMYRTINQTLKPKYFQEILFVE